MSVIACEVIKSDLMDKKPSTKLDSSKELLFSVIPEFEESYGFDQMNPWHIYDVYNHTLKVVDNVGRVLPLRIAALFHDMGKPYKFSQEDGVGHFYEHWVESLRIFDRHYKDFNLSMDDVILIRKLIFFHDLRFVNNPKMADFMVSQVGDDIDLLFDLKKADILAQNPEYKDKSLAELDNMINLCTNSKHIK